jgi:CheY-like chemotaxis protein
MDHDKLDAAPAEGGHSAPPPGVLVVEDEVLIRAAAGQYLRGCGFRVLEAVNADEALDILRADGALRVVFADVKLPGLRNGVDLARIVQADYPDTRLLLTSGVSPFPAVDGVALLKKPYFLVDLERQIRRLLGGAGHQRSPAFTKVTRSA